MNNLNYKNLSYISILFFAANFILSLSSTEHLVGSGFVVVAVCMLLLDKFKDMMIAGKMILALIMFLPVLLEANTQVRIAAIVVAVISLSFMRKHEDTQSRDRKFSFVQGVILLMFLMMFMGSMLSGVSFVNRYMIPYSILYVIFASFDIRQMRDREFNIIRQKTIKMDITYALLLAVMTVVLSVNVVRSFFVQIFSRVFMFLGVILYTLLNKIYLFVYAVLFKLSTGQSHKGGKIIKPEVSKASVKADNSVVDMKIYYIIGIVIVLVILIIIIIKLFKLQYKKESKNADFAEKKEYVKVEHEHKNKTKIYSHFKRGSFRDKIRYYYYKLMKDCSKRSIDIKKCDTTHDINKKAASSFNTEYLKDMRKIYLKARYTDTECTKEEYERFHMDYKEK